MFEISNIDSHNQLNIVILKALASKEFYACIIARALLWRIYGRYHRVLVNVASDDLQMCNMGEIYDTIYNSMKDIATDPSITMCRTYKVFDIYKYESTRNYNMSVNRIIIRCKSNHDIEKYLEELMEERIYDPCENDAELKNMVTELMKSYAEGIIDELNALCSMWLTHKDGQFSTAKWTDDMKEKHKRIALHSNNCERGFGLTDYLVSIIQNFKIPTAVGIVLSKYNKTVIDEDYVTKLLFVRKNRAYFRKEEENDMKQQLLTNFELNESNKQKEKMKIIKAILTWLSYNNLRLVKDDIELDTIINNNNNNQKKIIVFLKQQIIAFKSCYNLEVSTVMSSKNDPAIGQLADLLSRLKHILNMINNNNIQRMNVLPHSITSKKFDNITDFGTQSEVYIAAKDLAVKDSRELIDHINDMNERHKPKILQPWMNMILPTWPTDLTIEELQYKVNDRFTFKDNDDGIILYIYDGILYSNDKYIAYYHNIDNDINNINLDNDIICKIPLQLLVTSTNLIN